jgi:hypothetical protein
MSGSFPASEGLPARIGYGQCDEVIRYEAMRASLGAGYVQNLPRQSPISSLRVGAIYWRACGGLGQTNSVSATPLPAALPLFCRRSRPRRVACTTQETQECCCSCGRLIKTSNRILERPPRGGLSVCAACCDASVATGRFCCRSRRLRSRGDCLDLLKRLPINRLLEDGSIDLADTSCPPLVTQDMHQPLVVAWL